MIVFVRLQDIWDFGTGCRWLSVLDSQILACFTSETPCQVVVDQVDMLLDDVLQFQHPTS